MTTLLRNDMSANAWPEIVELLEKLLRPRKPTVEHVAEVLDADLRLVKRSSHSTYAAQLPGRPFAEADFHCDDGGQQARLNLMVAPQVRIAESSYAQDLFGPPDSVDIVPEVPPEGIFVHSFEFRGARVSLAFTLKSRILHYVAIAWGIPRTPTPADAAES